MSRFLVTSDTNLGSTLKKFPVIKKDDVERLNCKAGNAVMTEDQNFVSDYE